jgi:putative metallohydrolase (TIGR04338 family)
MRDTQRSKVYAAENFLTSHNRTAQMTLTECQVLVDKILDDPEVQRQYRVARALTVTVVPGRGGGKAIGGWGARSRISLGCWARQPYVVIHEVAHHLTGLHAGHDYRFANTSMWLVHRFMSAELAEQLRRSYVAHGVQYQGPASRGEMPRTVRKSQRVPRRWVSTPTFDKQLAAARRATVTKSTPKPKGKTCRTGHGPCSKCGAADSGSGGSFGKPLCLKCYRAWRKQIATK